MIFLINSRYSNNFFFIPTIITPNIQKIFEQYDSDQLPDLKSFCYALKDLEGNPIDPLAKIDAVDFLYTFFDQLESALKSLGKDQILNEPFRGKILHETLPEGCPHVSSLPEDFYTIPLTVRHSKDLEHSLAKFVQGEVMDGDNRFLCDQCQKKVNAIKRICLSEIPNHLCFTLKRFELDFDIMEIVLLKNYFELPNIISLKPLTHEPEKNEEEEKNSYTENNRYRLSGAVIYNGSSPDRGVYYSLVKDREDGETWYKIGPQGKEEFEFKDFPEEAFGGEEDRYL